MLLYHQKNILSMLWNAAQDHRVERDCKEKLRAKEKPITVL
jgi:hypothetical protein